MSDKVSGQIVISQNLDIITKIYWYFVKKKKKKKKKGKKKRKKDREICSQKRHSHKSNLFIISL